MATPKKKSSIVRPTTVTKPTITADVLRNLPDSEVQDLLRTLGPAKAEELKYNWRFWARPEQLEPVGDWNTWVALAGRGWGKTRAGAEWVRHRIMKGDGIVHCVAPTKGDVRRVMVEGDSGLLNVCWKGDKTYRGKLIGYPVWSPTNNTMTWDNGARAVFFSAEDPERLRGPQAFSAWCDELCAWRNAQETWDMLQFGLRLGRRPQVFVTTTPKTTKLIRTVLGDDKTIVSRGSTYDNSANLADTFLEAVRKTYEGTRLGRQELYAEILDEASGALWNRALLASCEVDKDSVPSLSRIVVAIDPAVTANAESDMTGIVVAGIDVNGTAYVLEDHTGRYTPQQWASKAISLYHEHMADRIVAERNQGGDMVRHTLHTEDETVPVKLVHASRGKMARAEPVSALYEQKKVKHVRGLNELEDQMVQWEPLGSIGSPDRLDALVWAITDLSLNGYAKPQLKLVYSDNKGLR
jgi:phage terminase large subunit-like protein